MKNILRLALAICLFACLFAPMDTVSASAESEIHLLFDIPFGLSKAEVLTMVEEKSGLVLEDSTNFVENAWSVGSKALNGLEMLSMPVSELYFSSNMFGCDGNGTYIAGLVFFSNANAAQVAPAFDELASLYGKATNLSFQALSGALDIDNLMKDYKAPVKNNKFNTKALEKVLKKNDYASFTARFDNIEFGFVQNCPGNAYIYAQYQQADELLPVAEAVPQEIQPMQTQTVLEVGEWTCPEHIAPGEYRVMPLDGAAINVTRPGRSSVIEYLDAKKGDAIGRLVLKSGDSLEISFGTMIFKDYVAQ